MTADLRVAYCNPTAEGAAFAEQLRISREEVCGLREEYSERFAARHGEPEVGAVALLIGPGTVLGVEWPVVLDPPLGWRQSTEQPRVIVPTKSTPLGKAALAELRRLTWPDYRRGLSRLGVPDPVFVAGGYTDGQGRKGAYHRAVVGTYDPDRLWVAWRSPDVVDAPELAGIAELGWEQRPVEEYLAVAGR